MSDRLVSSSTKFGMGHGNARPPLTPNDNGTDIGGFPSCRMPRADSAESTHAFCELEATDLAGQGENRIQRVPGPS